MVIPRSFTSLLLFICLFSTINMMLLLRLRETNNALQLPVFFFFSFFGHPHPEYRGIRSKNLFSDHRTANTIQIFVP